MGPIAYPRKRGGRETEFFSVRIGENLVARRAPLSASLLGFSDVLRMPTPQTVPLRPQAARTPYAGARVRTPKGSALPVLQPGSAGILPASCETLSQNISVSKVY